MKAPKLTIKQKLLLSYLSMALLTVVASAYAMIGLQRLYSVAQAITKQDYAILENSKTMMDALLIQESTEKKFLIFKDPSFIPLFEQRSHELRQRIERIRQYHHGDLSSLLARLLTLQRQYDALFQREAILVQANQVAEATVLSDKEGKIIIDEMAASVKAISKKAEQDIANHMNAIQTQGLHALRITIALSALSLIAGFSLALLITYNIARPLRKLERATALIAEGKFTNDLNMNRQDAIGSLARAFIVMAERL